MLHRSKKPQFNSTRPRQPQPQVTETFRRNNVVISRRQQELAERQQSVTQRQQAHQKAASRRRFQLRTAGIVIICGLLFIGYRSSVNTVKVSSNASTKLSSQKQADYQAAIEKLYAEHTLMGQGWLLDEAALRQAVLERYPEIERVDFDTTMLVSRTLTADVRFRKPVFTWKDASGLDQFVDSEGVLFATNLDPTVNTTKLIRIEDQSGAVLQTGSSVLTKSLIEFIGQLHGRLVPLYGKNAVVARVIIPQSTREVQVQMQGLSYLLKFNSNRSLNEQIGELQSVLNFLKEHSSTPGAYIDLRVAHKAFYR